MLTSIAPRIALSDFAELDDPYPLYKQLRNTSPIFRAGGNQWFVTRFNEVDRLLKEPSLRQFQISAVLKQFPASADIQTLIKEPATVFTESILAGQDGADHKALRRHMVHALGPSLVEIDQIIHSELDEIIEDVKKKRKFDVVQDLAFILPIRVLGRIIGIPLHQQEQVAHCALKLASVFSQEYISASRTDVNDALLWLRECISSILSKRDISANIKSNTDNFIDRFLQATHAEWSSAHIVDNIIFLLFAGFETSLNLIANGFDALMDFPEQQQKLREDRKLIPFAIEEFLRFNSPVHITGRFTTEPIHVAGQRIGSGRVVYLGLASANRDPDQFHCPDVLDITRQKNSHLAFGAGPHQCLGALIARREAILLYSRFIDEFEWFSRIGEKERAKNATLRSLKRLPISVE